MVSPLLRLVRRLRHKRLHAPVVRVKWIRLGSDYGGWPVATTNLPSNPVVYSFGVGEDISFDLAVAARFAAVVHAFDPTPRSQKWLEGQDLPENFHFHPIGIAASDGQVKFFPPENDAHVSFSKTPSHGSAAPVVAEVRTLGSILHDLGGPAPTIVKMDIEGFEYEVIDALVASDIRPPQLLIEFHQGMYTATNADTLAAVAKLDAIGYKVFFVSDTGREYGFILSA